MEHLSNKQKKELIKKLPKEYNISKKDELIKNNQIIYKNKIPILIIEEDKILPHLKFIPENIYKSIYVDKGTIPFIMKGADIMRPGITKIENEIEVNDIVQIKDENHNKTLALGFALLNSLDMEKQKNGKSIKVYHYILDKYYKI